MTFSRSFPRTLERINAELARLHRSADDVEDVSLAAALDENEMIAFNVIVRLRDQSTFSLTSVERLDPKALGWTRDAAGGWGPPPRTMH